MEPNELKPSIRKKKQAVSKCTWTKIFLASQKRAGVICPDNMSWQLSLQNARYFIKVKEE